MKNSATSSCPCAEHRPATEMADLLRGCDLKVTEIRVALLKQLHRSPTPLSAEELAKAVQTSLPAGADLVSVYRNLKTFLNSGLIQSTELGTGSTLYEWVDKTHHHHHVICRQCRRVEAVPFCGLEASLGQLQQLGYQQVSHRLEFFGLCQNCSGKKNRSSRRSH